MSQPQTKRQTILVCLFLALTTLGIYWPVRHHEFIDYDDQEYVSANPMVQQGLTKESVVWAFTKTHSANWHPLTWLSHMLDWQLFGQRAGGHHFTNVIFHAANAVLLFLLLQGWTKATWRSALVAALFALHPLHVESVAWVAERKDVLSGFFGLLTLLAYAQYVRIRKLQTPELWIWYLFALVFYVLSLMSKAMLVTLPFLLLLLDYWPLQRWQFSSGVRRTVKPLLLEKIPFLLLTVGACLVTYSAQDPALKQNNWISYGPRAANAVVSYVRYLSKAFWPDGLAVFYPHPGTWPVGQIIGAAALLILITTIVVFTARKQPHLFVGWFWFLGMLVPVIGLVQVGAQSMADRYTYFPLIGVFIMVVWSVGGWIAQKRFPSATGFILGTALLISCAAGTYRQLGTWRNTETIFTHATQVTKGNWVAHYNLAQLSLHQYQQARGSAVEMQQMILQQSATSSIQGLLDKVIFHCRAAAAGNPTLPDIRITLAKALIEINQLEEASAQLETAIRLAPRNPDARQNLAELFMRQGRVSEAITQYKEALQIIPDWPEVLNNLAWLLATHPKDSIRNGNEAVQLAQRACKLTGQTNLWYFHTLAAAQAEAGDFTAAVATGEKAVHLAQKTGIESLIQTAEKRVRLYQTRQPYRDANTRP